jgi:hypothetical protein
MCEDSHDGRETTRSVNPQDVGFRHKARRDVETSHTTGPFHLPQKIQVSGRTAGTPSMQAAEWGPLPSFLPAARAGYLFPASFRCDKYMTAIYEICHVMLRKEEISLIFISIILLGPSGFPE